MKAGLDKDGKIVAWRHRIVGQSIMAARRSGRWQDRSSSVEGASTLPYRHSELTVELHTTTVPVPFSGGARLLDAHGVRRPRRSSTTSARDESDLTSCAETCLAKHKDAERFIGVLDLVAKDPVTNHARTARSWGPRAWHEGSNTVVGEVAHVTRQRPAFDWIA